MIEFLDAAHNTIYVQSEFEQRGCVMLLGQPGGLKTTMIEIALNYHPNAALLGDLNVSSLSEIRAQLISNRYSTLAFPEYEKLYQRKSDSAINMEGILKQIIEEGFTRTSFETQDAVTAKARALVVGAMTHDFYMRRIGGWNKSGFARRILWSSITMRDPNKLMRAVREWRKINIDGIPRMTPAQDIPMNVTKEESEKIEKAIKQQWEVTPYVLLKKVMTILKWKYAKNPKRAWDIFDDFAPSLSKSRFEPITF